MGFRSTFATMDYAIKWPAWFVEKWKGSVHFGSWQDSPAGALASKFEGKMHNQWVDLPEDVQKAIDWKEWEPNAKYPFLFVICFMHECGGVTRCHITREAIRWSEPDGWGEVDHVTHSYCDKSDCCRLSAAEAAP